VSSSQDLILSDASDDDYLGNDKNSATSLWSEGSKSWLFTSLRRGRGPYPKYGLLILKC